MKKKDELKVKSIVTTYKKNLSNCMKNGDSIGDSLLFFDSESDAKNYFDDSLQKISEEKKFILRINFALSCIDPVLSKIIWKEFFFQMEKFWWMRDFTRSTFYRLRKKAIREFLCYVN